MKNFFARNIVPIKIQKEKMFIVFWIKLVHRGRYFLIFFIVSLIIEKNWNINTITIFCYFWFFCNLVKNYQRTWTFSQYISPFSTFSKHSSPFLVICKLLKFVSFYLVLNGSNCFSFKSAQYNWPKINNKLHFIISKNKKSNII